MSASKIRRNRNTCVPRADGGTRAHALWPLRILFFFSSPLFYLSSLSCPSFFIHAILHTRLPCFHRSTESTTGVLLLAANRHERSIRSLLVFGSILCDEIENVRSVSRIRGKRCHVQRLPTSMMQLAFNPHSRILKFNSTVQRETGLH